MKIIKGGRTAAAVTGVLSLCAGTALVLMAPQSAQAAPGLPNYPSVVNCYKHENTAGQRERIQLLRPTREGGAVSYKWYYQYADGNNWNTGNQLNGQISGTRVARDYAPTHRPEDQICAAYTNNGFPQGVVVSWG